MPADPCPNCGSHHLLADVPVMQHDGTASLSVMLYAPPIELLGVPLWQGTRTLPLRARICTACGHTALFVADPSTVAQLADQRPSRASTEPSLHNPTE